MNSETNETSEPVITRGGWLVWTARHPVLTFLGPCLFFLLIALSLSLVGEWRRMQARDFLRNDPRFKASSPRLRPIALQKWLPQTEISSNLVVEMDRDLLVKAPLSASDIDLINQLDSFETIRFNDKGEVTDEGMRLLVQRQPLMGLFWSGTKTLSSETLRSIGMSSKLGSIGDLAGPFDQAMVDALTPCKRSLFLVLDGPILPGVRPAFPTIERLAWKNSQLTDDAFLRLMDRQLFRGLWIMNTQLTSKSWPLLARFKGTYLGLASPNIEPSIGNHIPVTVNKVHLEGGRLSDDAIRDLVTGAKRVSLAISASGLTDKAAQYLASSGVKDLHLFTAETVDDVWARELAKSELIKLTAENSKITDEGLRHLRSITYLSLPGSQLTDQCIPVLNDMPNLEYLDLRNSGISDVGLDQLAPATETKLFWIELNGTRVTADGAKRFLARHPDVSLKYTEEPSASH